MTARARRYLRIRHARAVERRRYVAEWRAVAAAIRERNAHA